MAGITEQEHRELVENGLIALRRATEKALRSKVITRQDLNEVGERLSEAGFSVDQSPTDPGSQFEDPNLALAEVRISLEQQLRKLTRSSASNVVDLVYEFNQFTEPQKSALVSLITLLNSAVHGADVTPDAPEWAKTQGRGIVGSLNRFSKLDGQNHVSGMRDR